MAKKWRNKPERELCTYCGSAICGDDVTRDHVIARRWYPDSTAANIQKPWVLSCKACNNRKSYLEQQTFVGLALCVDPKSVAAAGIYERAKLSFNPAATDDPREQQARRAFRDQIVSRMGTTTSEIREGTLPSFAANYAKGSRTTLRINANELNELVCMWAKGFHRRAWGAPLVAGASVEKFFISENAAVAAFKETLGRWSGFDGGPGVRVNFLGGTDGQSRATVFRFQLWGAFVAYANIDESEAGIAA
ncbi:MAG TPA: HNH endonuclease signature motif containing protein [Magnetospirillaceae bacterium]|jgi:hypothetical protein